MAAAGGGGDGAGLVCPQGFPAAFGSFTALETLMLRYNDFSGDTLAHVAEVRILVHEVRPVCSTRT